MLPTIENASLLPKQYVIAKHVLEIFDQWNSKVFGDWTIATAPELPVIQINDSNGNEHSCLIGWAIHNEEILKHNAIIKVDPEEFQNFYEKLCGRFIILYTDDNSTYIKPDASALLPLVYSSSIGVAGSTPTVMVPWNELETVSAIQEAFDLPNSVGWYPCGLTAFKGVKRLLPNHSLCLDTWQTKRFWPLKEDGTSAIPKSSNPRETSIEIAKIVQSHVSTLAESGHRVAHITAGYDTRMVIAATRKYSDDFLYETVRHNALGRATNLDCHIAGQIAKGEKLNHVFIEFVDPAKKDVDDWLNRVGYCMRDEVTELATTAKLNDRNCFILSGVCVEVGRAYYWSREPDRNKNVTPEGLLKTLGHPIIPETIAAADEWIKGMPVPGGCLFWDMVLIEQRQACWGGANVLGHNVSFPSFTPVNSYEIYQLMLSLPEAYRESQQFARDYIEFLWPELLKYPFNKAGGLSRLKYLKAEITSILPNEVVTKLKRIKKKIGL